MTKLPDGNDSELLTFLCFKPEKLKLKLDRNKKLSDAGAETEVDRFSIGNLTGIQMAIEGLRVESAGKFEDFVFRDYVTFECTDVVQASKPGYSDMLKFRISVSDGF